jgi:hypothetical protein
MSATGVPPSAERRTEAICPLVTGTASRSAPPWGRATEAPLCSSARLPHFSGDTSPQRCTRARACSTHIERPQGRRGGRKAVHASQAKMAPATYHTVTLTTSTVSPAFVSNRAERGLPLILAHRSGKVNRQPGRPKPIGPTTNTAVFRFILCSPTLMVAAASWILDVRSSRITAATDFLQACSTSVRPGTRQSDLLGPTPAAQGPRRRLRRRSIPRYPRR